MKNLLGLMQPTSTTKEFGMREFELPIETIRALLVIGGVVVLISLLLNFLFFRKIGLPGWKGIVPFYSTYTSTTYLTGSKSWGIIHLGHLVATILFSGLSVSSLKLYVPLLMVYTVSVVSAIEIYKSLLYVKGFNRSLVDFVMLNTPIGFVWWLLMIFNKKWQFYIGRLSEEQLLFVRKEVK